MRKLREAPPKNGTGSGPKLLSKHKILGFVLASLLSANAGALEVSKNKAGHIILSDISCEDIPAQSKALRQWTEGTEATCRFGRVRKKGALCEMDLQNCLPAHVKKYQGANPAKDGPNCWNLALVAKNLLPYLRMSSNEEMSFFMNSGMCQQIGNGEKPAPGDIGAIRKKDTNCRPGEAACEVHGFIYVSEQLAYSKNSQDALDSYALQDINHVYSLYDAGPFACSEVGNSSACPVHQIDFFRCQSFPDFLAKAKAAAEYRKAFEVLDFAECKVSGASMRPVVFDQKEKTNIAAAIGAVTGFLNRAEEATKSPDESFLYEALGVRLRSMAEQVNLFPYAPVNPGFPSGKRQLDEKWWKAVDPDPARQSIQEWPFP